MKKYFVAFLLSISSVVCARNNIERRIEKLIEPYQTAINFVAELDTQKINDHDVFIFFNKTPLYEKKDIRKFNSTVRMVTRLARSKKVFAQDQAKFEELINHLYAMQSFIKNHSATYFALITYYEICAYYYYLDEHNPLIVDALIQQTEQLGLPCMQHRGLYKLHKKIGLDLRRLTALFTQNIISDDLITKINQIKTKLLTLTSKIEVSPQYKKQRGKTRLLKAFGVLLMFPCCATVSLVWTPLLAASWLAGQSIVSCISGYGLISFGMTIHELRESTRYNIPVHSSSLFSWFMPVFWPLTWIPRS